MTEKMSADFLTGRGRGTRDEKNWKAKFLPSQNLSANREVGKSASRKGNGQRTKFSPNEFGAQEISSSTTG
jgi:hypothetical protein